MCVARPHNNVRATAVIAVGHPVRAGGGGVDAGQERGRGLRRPVGVPEQVVQLDMGAAPRSRQRLCKVRLARAAGADDDDAHCGPLLS